MPNWIEQADAQLSALLADWSLLTTLIALTLLAFVAYPIFYAAEPDTHPLLLARQSTASPIRQKNESSVYRSPEVPYGYPLKTGLNVKDVGAPRWASGKDGDLRDVWREVQRGGSVGEDGKAVPQGSIMTVLGKEEVVEHGVEEMSKEIDVIGKHLSQAGVKKVAIYLPNSVEYLQTIFACAFYGLTPILLPYNQPHQKVYDLVNATGADALICAAGNLPLDAVAKHCQNLHLLTWVVEKTSRHMDWNGVPDAAHDRLSVSVWHDIIAEQKTSASAALPTNEQGAKPGDLITVTQPSNNPQAKPEIVTFTQANLVAATAALITTLPLRQRFTPADLVLPADAFTHTYVLCQTLAALFTHASLAINSVAGPGVDLALASRSISPTVIIASAETLAAIHTTGTAGISSAAQKLGKYTQAQAMSAGRMPTDNMLFRVLSPSATASGNAPGKLRLILVAERVGGGSPALSSTTLSDLRIFTRARICYALTAPQVAGAIAQTNVFDYRRVDGGGHSHFGTPLSSVEVKLVAGEDGNVAGNTPRGEMVVMGPAVSGGGEVRLPVQGRVRVDGTLGYA
ncbi:hypothetical protein LTR36_004439 [Oleoguttula mirabilis]|uniref:AMP-dependent synthetase/ligase domain-containing protein n=1 Tax=Oleoguttula mirabilis TaxID=1507867 RepID=A0AAV9JIA7_9PEZI|nr:hypothetical protein LTR36_004439 [Oleoguttula mirabilis]